MALLNRTAVAADVDTKVEVADVDTKVEVADVDTKAEVVAEVVDKAKASDVSEVRPAGSLWFNNEAVQAVVATAVYGDFPQIIAAQGSFTESGANGKDLGKTITFKPIISKAKFVCAPGSNDEEAKEYFAAAYEGELTADGLTIDECVEDAKSAGYDKASKKEYADLFAYVVSHESGADFEGETVILQLSPMSRINWSKFAKKLEMKAAFGQLQMSAEGIEVKATAKAMKNKGGQAYTTYEFELI